MKNDIVLAGVGGQGILTIAAIIARAAMQAGLHAKQSEVHGMSQRGGSVEAHLRLSSNPIHSDLIAPGTADVILAVEPMEALRQLACLAPDGAVLANANPVRNIPDYPDTNAILDQLKRHPKAVVLDAEGIATATAGSARAMNMVMLGAVSAFLDLPPERLQNAVADMFARKGQKVVDSNLAAFAAGRDAALQK